MTKNAIDCFVIMPISNQPSYEDGHFTLVYEDIIKPVIEELGFRSIRADETQNTNLIQLDILKKVIESPIAVCDMSARNPNVFYELGIRQAFDLPTVLLKDDCTEAPFDINGLRYVTYNKNMLHRNVLDAKSKLKEALKTTHDKKDDKTEINSIIRLMELTSAELKPLELNDNQKIEKLIELNLSQLHSSINYLISKQENIINSLDEKVRTVSAKNIDLTIKEPRDISQREFFVYDNELITADEYSKLVKNKKRGTQL